MGAFGLQGLPIPGADLALTYEDIPSLTSLPRRVAIVGGADTGCQMASIFADLGAATTLFEAGPILVPGADPSVSAELDRAFRARGMDVHTGTMVETLGRETEGIPEYGRVGRTETQARRHHDIVVGIAHYDDLLEIRTLLRGVSGARVSFDYAVHREGETEPLATGMTAHAAVDGRGRPRRLPTELRSLLA